MQKTITALDGIHINYDIDKKTKSSQCIFFLHGLGGDLRAWDAEREAMRQRGYMTVAIDLRGHGLSDRPSVETAYSFSNFASDINLVILHEKLRNVVVVGHCFGGMVSMYLTYLYPKDLSALVLVDTSYKPPFFSQMIIDHKLLRYCFSLLKKYSPGLHSKSTVNYNRFIGGGDFDKRRLLSDVMHTSIKNYLLISETVFTFDSKKLLDAIRIPTLVIEGTKDTVFPPTIARYLHKRIKKSQLEFIKDANHIIVLNNPKELVESILQFVAKIK